MTTLALITHGETASNLAGLFQGQSNDELHECGRRRFHALAASLSKTAVDIVFSSAQRRAVESASILSRLSAIPGVAVDPNLGERHLGRLDGRSKAAVLTEDLGLRVKLLELDFRPDGGEATSKCLDRFRSAVETILDRGYERVLAETHGGVATVFALHMLGVSQENCFLDHGEAHVMTRRHDGGLQLIGSQVPPDALAAVLKGRMHPWR